jgi:undecaprenyl-diphosphatase
MTISYREQIAQIDRRWTTRIQMAAGAGWVRTLASVLAHSGDSWIWLLGLGAVFVLADEIWRPWALTIILSILVIGVIVGLIKFLVRRKRPDGEWGQIYRRTDPYSFPSGHAARATLLTIFVIIWGPLWLGAIFLLWTIAVSLARIAMALHYVSVVLMGVLIGGAAGVIIVLLIGT